MLGLFLLGAEPRVVQILAAPGGVGAHGLQMSVGPGADPHVPPGRRYHQAPDPVQFPLNEADQHMPPDGLAHIGSEAPPSRAAQPEEIAPTYVYLASDADSSYTVGEVIAVTGGIVDTR
ncbi:hypothetical protein GCM10010246_68160 [Streptomyces cuspidosporus]|uniref:Uncharacterized protein n=2 Tax=Streptomyces cuspidosporus TaxID=66882 RepID=A0ABN3H1Y9_9ACTN